MKLNVLLCRLRSVRHQISWQRVLECPRLANSLLKKSSLLILDKITKETCIALHLFLRTVYSMGRKSGWLFTALYLKQCSIHLKIAYGGVYVKNTPYPISVSLTGSGYPRIIPAFVRRTILLRNRRSELAVQLFLSFFTLFAIVEKGKVIKSSLFSSIKTPIADIDRVARWIGGAKPLFKELFLRYIPKIQSIPLEQGMRWIPSWKIVPTYTALNTLYGIFPEKAKYKGVKSPFLVQSMELSAFSFLVNFLNSRGEQWCQGILFEKRIRFPFDNSNSLFSGLDLESFEAKVGPYLPSWHPAMGPPMLGRLAQTVEGGGKRRLFAIGNWVNQRLLTPIHVWLASCLKQLPMDGTFNQLGPLTRLKGQQYGYCYDLTDATDRWPLVVMFTVMEVLFDRSFASAVVNSALATNRFFISFLPTSDIKNENHWISFIAGQPLGYRASWPLFSLSHHLVVWWAAEQIYPGMLFDRYALLGDDIVISDPAVAQKYTEVLSVLGVSISQGKSLISHTGAAEFAKRFVIKQFSTDLSPVSMKALLGVHVLLSKYALAHRYRSIRFSTFRRLGGAGYKSCSRLPPQLRSRRERYEWGLWMQLRWPSLEFFFGDGNLLPPAEFWWVLRQIVKTYRPKDLKEPPGDMFITSDQHCFQEYTGIRCWVEEWLGYYKWWLHYYQLTECYLDYCNPTIKKMIDRVSIDDVYAAPMCTNSWRLSNKDVTYIRFSLLQRIKELLDSNPPILYIAGKEWCSDEVQRISDYCLCASKTHIVYGEGLYPFSVSSLGLIIPRMAQCPGCLSRKRVLAASPLDLLSRL
ncbi:hypothetical protein SLEP1_g59181 [Rubroshorea leprosula]|uniref:RNA-dependent RNA polymerase n=1 Tax=Rubroshorea leprosula TaxID=152421 RepID=A0AAV5MST5_9ROSI|nr:hypothetical protein SLEP1_g59181 [Rubroshorea leprosula]